MARNVLGTFLTSLNFAEVEMEIETETGQKVREQSGNSQK